jgi:hypothetical protein
MVQTELDNTKEDSYNNKRKGWKRKNTAPDNQGSKERKVPALVIWYLPVIDHLKCMFSKAREAQLLLWHVQQKRDGKIRILLMVGSGNISTLATMRTFLKIQGILDLVLAPME